MLRVQTQTTYRLSASFSNSLRSISAWTKRIKFCKLWFECSAENCLHHSCWLLYKIVWSKQFSQYSSESWFSISTCWSIKVQQWTRLNPIIGHRLSIAQPWSWRFCCPVCVWSPVITLPWFWLWNCPWESRSFGLQSFMTRYILTLSKLDSICLFSKIIKLPKSSLHEHNTSQIFNMITNDIRRFDEFSLMIHYLILVPIQTTLILAISWYYIGPVCLATFGMFIMLAFVLSHIGKHYSALKLVHSQRILDLILSNISQE